MLKGENINGYIIQKDFETSGQSKYSTGIRDGEEFFIKEFFKPKYPTPESRGSEETKVRKQKRCKAFEEHHVPIVEILNEKCGRGGNLIYPLDFFRSGTTYYKVYENINVSTISVEELSKLPWQEKLIIFITITKSISILHSINLVHGDIKPDNILIKKTKKNIFTTKLIDFDNAYFSEKPPENSEEVVGDQVYYSPELAEYVMEGTACRRDSLTVKSDIFSLGLIFHLFHTAKIPNFDTKYKYCWEAVLDDNLSIIESSSNEKFNSLIQEMLSRSTEDRPDINVVFNKLKELQASAKRPSARKKEVYKTSRPESVISSKKALKISANIKKTKKEEKTEIAYKGGGLKGKLISNKTKK
ncbi:protein kinase domain-containing protein [Tenacibaculum amylolyticum]|uniref:protein kinase domain-containing protein n=1 Tax=Tenacibaculum amylolyticum TaxID=104269 RepID=UPI0038949D7F